MFWSTNNGGYMWDPETDPNLCMRTGGGSRTPACCGGNGRPYQIYNSDIKYCCDNGRLVNHVNQC